MKITIGKEGLDQTHQSKFSEKTSCECGGVARIAFVCCEGSGEESYICDLHNNEGFGGFWPHDAVAVAIYFCKKCSNTVALYNQA
jgi:hypothetical protein